MTLIRPEDIEAIEQQTKVRPCRSAATAEDVATLINGAVHRSVVRRSLDAQIPKPAAMAKTYAAFARSVEEVHDWLYDSRGQLRLHAPADLLRGQFGCNLRSLTEWARDTEADFRRQARRGRKRNVPHLGLFALLAETFELRFGRLPGVSSRPVPNSPGENTREPGGNDVDWFRILLNLVADRAAKRITELDEQWEAYQRAEQPPRVPGPGPHGVPLRDTDGCDIQPLAGERPNSPAAMPDLSQRPLLEELVRMVKETGAHKGGHTLAQRIRAARRSQ